MQSDELEVRRSPVAMSGEEFRSAGHRLVDRIADFLDSVSSRPVTPGESPSTVRDVLNAERGLPESGTDAGTLLDRAASLMFDHSLFNAHPRFWGYVTAGAAPIGVLGELLAAGANPNCGAWVVSPVASEIEGEAIRWVGGKLKDSADCGGVFVGGGGKVEKIW